MQYPTDDYVEQVTPSDETQKNTRCRSFSSKICLLQSEMPTIRSRDLGEIHCSLLIIACCFSSRLVEYCIQQRQDIVMSHESVALQNPYADVDRFSYFAQVASASFMISLSKMWRHLRDGTVLSPRRHYTPKIQVRFRVRHVFRGTSFEFTVYPNWQRIFLYAPSVCAVHFLPDYDLQTNRDTMLSLHPPPK
jgi:hypothetical protein